jgi:hypothetical protein
MPYVLKIRDDIPAGVLQGPLDLLPNTVQRKFPYEKVGQTGYRLDVPNAAVAVTAGVTNAEYAGLTAWFLSSVSSGAGAAATAAITTDTVANLADGETFTISDGSNSVTFEFVKTAGIAVAPPNIAVDISADTTADDVRDTIIGVVNGSILNVTAADGGASTVDLTNDNQNIATADQNATNSETSASGTFAITDFAGATDSDSLTPAEAAQDAQDVIDELAAGNALTLAAINAALTTGSVLAEQVSEILDILAGRHWVVPAGSTVETGGAFVPGTGAFADDVVPFRRLYLTGAFRMSWAEGRLSKMRSADFTYGGTTGAAVVAYADDGSLFAL